MNEHEDIVSTEATNTVACNNRTDADLDGELWRPVIGWEEYYEVSNMGRLRRHSSDYKGGILNLSINNHGYARVTLCKTIGGKRYVQYSNIHRLVAMSFIPNPDNKPCVDHINTIRTDNRVSNLRWATYAENYANPLSKAKLSASLKRAKNTPEGIETNRRAQLLCKGTPESRKQNELAHAFQKIRIMCEETGEVFDGINAAARALNMKPSTIGMSVRSSLAGKPRLYKERKGKQVLHFIPVDKVNTFTKRLV